MIGARNIRCLTVTANYHHDVSEFAANTVLAFSILPQFTRRYSEYIRVLNYIILLLFYFSFLLIALKYNYDFLLFVVLPLLANKDEY